MSAAKLRRTVNRWRPTRYKWRRRFIDRCDHCNQHARWTESWHTYGNSDGKVWHGPCMAYEQWRSHAEEARTVVALIAEVAGLSSQDVQTVAALCEEEWTGRGRYQDLVWRVFYALEQRPRPVQSESEQR